MRNDTLSGTPIADFISTRGWRHYELSNHLGNVQAKVADYIQGDDDENPEVEVCSSQDYYAFGMQMPGRKFGTQGRMDLMEWRWTMMYPAMGIAIRQSSGRMTLDWVADGGL